MTNKKVITVLISAILLTLGITLFWATPALADGETPPPTETPVVTEQNDTSASETVEEEEIVDGETPPPTEIPVVTEQNDTSASETVEEEIVDGEAPLPTEIPVATEQNNTSTSETVEEGMEDGVVSNELETGTQAIDAEVALQSGSIDTISLVSDEDTADGLIEQIQADTELIILDESGNVLPLASEEASQIIATGDPIWCPAGVAPVANTGGCTDSFDQFNGGLLTALSGKTTAGVIWIAAAYDSSLEGGAVTLDGSLGTTVNYALTIQGGWNGLSGSKVVIGTSTIEVPFIINWNSNVTINDIIITGVTGSSSTALTVTTPKNIKLTRVQINSNEGSGANLDNQTGIGTVTIVASEFDDNSGGDGLFVESKGLITLTDITASGNGGKGATLSNNFSGTAAGITFTGSSIFSENTSNGVEVYSRGAITVSNLVNDLNGDWGAILDNSDALTARAVTVKGSSNEFKYNGSGIKIETKGLITLNSIIADYNLTGRGVELRNDQFGSISNVSITGTNSFSNNGDTGLYVQSYGIITVNNITANTNVGDGVFLDNSDAASPKGITLTGVNIFNENSGHGLDLQSDGAILVNNLTANKNSGNGVSLKNDSSGAVGAVILNVSGKFNTNGWSGLVISSKGAITLNNITANENGQANTDPTIPPYDYYGYGALIFNAASSTSPQNVTINGANTFNDNWLSGLEISSFGSIITKNLTANDNGIGNYSDAGNGALLDNCIASGPCSATIAKPILINGTNNFNSNYSSGLEVFSFGAITANALTSQSNANGYGVFLENDFSSAKGAVALKGSNNFVNNYLEGLTINSNGTITLNNITATGNGDGSPGTYGVSLINSGSVSPLTVVLSGSSNLDSNNGGGLYIETKGAITLTAITASNSLLGPGVKLDNTFGGSVQNISIKAINNFSGNYSNGIEIVTNGLISLNSVTANDNGWGIGGGHGALLNNGGTSAPKAVTLKGTNTFVGNGSDGINITTKGSITLNIVEASNNGDTGAVLDNNLSGAAGGVTVIGKGCTYNSNSGYGCFNGNGENGLDITSKGVITLTMINVQNNVGHGASLNNSSGTGGIIMKIISGFDSANQFSGNGTYGLNALTHGAISIANLRAGFNTTYGAVIDNSGSSLPVFITLSGSSNLFTNNGDNGLEVYSKGLIKVANLTAKNNDGYGAVLDNTDIGPGSPQNVSLTGTNYFSNNDFSGLQVHSYGIITINNLTANSNGTASVVEQGYGVFLRNYWDGVSPADHPATVIAKQVTLTGINTFKDNFEDGIRVVAKGAIVGSKVTASGNGGNGAFLKNQWGAGSVGGISLTGTNIFIDNSLLGLEAYSHGAITINNLSASLNVGGNITNGDGTFDVGGVYLENWSLTALPTKVTLTGTSSLTDNGNSVAHTGSGLMVYSDGAITLNNITASRNANGGAILNNDHFSSIPAAITLTGTSQFIENYGDGLYFESSGTVSLAKIRSDGNGGDGLAGTADGNITLTCGSMTFNGGYGWNLSTITGVIKLIGVFGIGNTSDNYANVTPIMVRTCTLP